MGDQNFNFGVLSLNVRGLNNITKRRSVFRWLHNRKEQIILLQETYSTKPLQNVFKAEWGGRVYSAHGTNHSRGVAILLKNNFGGKITEDIYDDEGRWLLLKIEIDNEIVSILNIYSPNKEREQLQFYTKLKYTLNKEATPFCKLIIGGDFNVPLNETLDKKGGIPDKREKVVQKIEEISEEFNLHDIWRIKNPSQNRYTWRKMKPEKIQCRLDYILISDSLHDAVTITDIIPSIRSDHSAVTVTFNTIPLHQKGNSFWKMNTSVLEDIDYINLLKNEKDRWTNEYKDIQDHRVKWELIKYNIRKLTFEYCNQKSKRKRNKEKDLEKKFISLSRQLETNTIEKNETVLNGEIDLVKEELHKINEEKTQGAILRTKIKWSEEGEKSTKYFLNLESRNNAKKTMAKLMTNDGKYTTNPKEILDIQKQFYEKLYSSSVDKENKHMEYFDSVKLPSLQEYESKECEGYITEEECSNVIKKLKKGKSPGNDGIPYEFYIKFWPWFGRYLVQSLNTAFDEGEMSTSQKQAIITLIDKNKDRTLLTNWRPISLLNCDYKIASKVLANRLTKHLPLLIHHNQSAYVDNRNIYGNIRSALDILEITRREKIPGIILAIDFEKAFDTVSRSFLFKTLDKFGLGPNFVQWIKVFYNNSTSCVINNGTTSAYFPIQQGVRQGDPISAYLFIMVVEIMAEKIRQNEKIKGLNINDTEIKVLQYADDTTAFISDTESIRELLSTIETFGAYSGLKINKSKTEALWIGSESQSRKKPIGIKWPEKAIKLLGIYISNDRETSIKLNVESRITKIKNLINTWYWRNLTLIGKIQIVKSLLISQLQYLFAVYPIEDNYIKDINTSVFKFIWNGKKDKIKRKTLVKDICLGGLSAPHLKSMIMASRITWIKRYYNSENSFWKTTWNYFMKKMNPNPDLLWYCNFDNSSLNCENIPSFYIEIVHSWLMLKRQERKGNIMTAFIWNNENIKIEGKTIYWKSFMDLGIWTLSDILDKNKTIIPYEFWQLKGLHEYLKWRTLAQIANQNKNLAWSDITPENSLSVTINKIVTPLEKTKTKAIYKQIRDNLIGTETTIPRVQKFKRCQKDWKKTYLISFKHFSDTKTRDFHFKFLNDILVNNYWLKKWKIKVDDKCRLCKDHSETLLHQFWKCRKIQTLWSELQNKLNSLGIDIKITEQDILFGQSENSITAHIINVTTKRYIYIARFKEEIPKLTHYTRFLQSHVNLEFEIAKKYNKLPIFLERWTPLKNFIRVPFN